MGILLSIYILVWPLMSAAVLILICWKFIGELREARAKGLSMV